MKHAKLGPYGDLMKLRHWDRGRGFACVYVKLLEHISSLKHAVVGLVCIVCMVKPLPFQATATKIDLQQKKLATTNTGKKPTENKKK